MFVDEPRIKINSSEMEVRQFSTNLRADGRTTAATSKLGYNLSASSSA